MAIREGLWDCPACEGTNRGRHLRCQGCGQACGEEVRFYLPEGAPAILPDNPLFQQARAGADWICGYCDASNRGDQAACLGCGAAMEDSRHRPVTETRDRGQGGVGDAGQSPAPPPTPARRSLTSGCCSLAALKLGGLLLLPMLLLGWWAGRTHEVPLRVAGARWERTIELEALVPEEREGWRDRLPAEARVLARETRVRSHRRVLIGTETRQRTVTRKVPDGVERTKCGTRDLGNGFFEDVFCERPRYRRVSHREPYEHRIYRQEPIQDEWVRYQVDTWAAAPPARLEGRDHQPRWPTPALGPRLREVRRSGHQLLELAGPEGSIPREVSEEVLRRTPPGATLVGLVNNNGRLVELRWP